jgi:hypothetical protein
VGASLGFQRLPGIYIYIILDPFMTKTFLSREWTFFFLMAWGLRV